METDCALFICKLNASSFLFYEDRLSTFQNWPRQFSSNKFPLAKAGLYYTGESDIVKCFACGVRLHQWLTNDTALAEHKKWSRDCIFLKMIGYGECENYDQPFISFKGYFPSDGVSR